MIKYGTTFVIKDDSAYKDAESILQEIVGKRHKLESQRKEQVKPLDDAKKAIQQTFHEWDDPLSESEKALRKSMAAYIEGKERMEKEILAVAKAQANVRLEQAKADKEKAIADGDLDKAESIVLDYYEPPALVKLNDPKESTSTRDSWKAEVIDLMQLIKAVANGEAPITCLKADTTVLNQMARATKGTLDIPGVNIHKETTIVAR